MGRNEGRTGGKRDAREGEEKKGEGKNSKMDTVTMICNEATLIMYLIVFWYMYLRATRAKKG